MNTDAVRAFDRERGRSVSIPVGEPHISDVSYKQVFTLPGEWIVCYANPDAANLDDPKDVLITEPVIAWAIVETWDYDSDFNEGAYRVSAIKPLVFNVDFAELEAPSSANVVGVAQKDDLFDFEDCPDIRYLARQAKNEIERVREKQAEREGTR